VRRKRVSERPGTSAAASLLEWLITIRQPDQPWDVLQVINRLNHQARQQGTSGGAEGEAVDEWGPPGWESLLDEPLVDLSQRDAFFRELAG
jgi:hypothetical protein